MIQKSLVLLMLFMTAISGMGQEIYYYGANDRPVNSPDESLFSKEINRKSQIRYELINRVRTNDTWMVAERQKIKVQSEGRLKIRIKGERFFPTKIKREISKSEPELYYFEETWGEITRRTGTSSNYLPLHLEGQVNEFHKNGRKKSVSMFRDNQIMSNQNWLPDGTPYIDSIYYSADQNPEFMPGQEFFRDYLMQQIKNSKINLEEYEDRVVIGWVVMENGEIDGVIALEGKSLTLNQLLVDIIAQIPGAWEPAVLDGHPVRYFMSIPLNFMHKDAKFQDLTYTWGVLHYNRY